MQFAELVRLLEKAVRVQKIIVDEELLLQDRFLPHGKAPVVMVEDGKVHLRAMNFSLVPNWSKDARPKFATHNARIESVLEKPTWKKPFLQHHCLVPISAFFEPIYEGEYAGHMVRFFERNKHLLLAAGIFDAWTNPQTGEVIESFSILTSEPPPFVAQVGHDRCPYFIDEKILRYWLDPRPQEGARLLQLLEAGKAQVDFAVEVDRALKGAARKGKTLPSGETAT